ncbi:unnamed protein product, partial [Pylaiella littoralis]
MCRWSSGCAIIAVTAVGILATFRPSDAAATTAINNSAVAPPNSLYPGEPGLLDNGTAMCENWRRSSNQDCIDPGQCGKGWLFRRKGLLLAVVLPTEHDASAPRNGSAEGETDWTQGAAWRRGQYEWHTETSGMVNVIGLAEGGNGELSDCSSQDLSMLVRLQGPEALAEAAIPVTGRCAWTVQFRPTLEGVFTLDVTLLNWKGGLEGDWSKYNAEVGQYGEGSVEMDEIKSGPFYGTFEACCSLCTRADGCVAWSATSTSKVRVNGSLCTLYSSVVGQPVENKLFGGAIRSGTPREGEFMMYLGPSMTISRRWCTERNTNVLGSGQQFVVKSAAKAREGQRQQQQQEEPAAAITLEVEGSVLPLCSGDTTSLPHDGRWISLRDTQCDLDPAMMCPNGWPKYQNNTFGVTMPETCLLRPFDTSSSTDYARFAQGGYMWQPYDCRYDLMNSEARVSCFRDKNITKFLDFGDSLISTSRAARSALWLPYEDASVFYAKPTPINKQVAQTGCVGAQVQRYGEANGQAYCGAASMWQAKPNAFRSLVSSFKPDVVLANWALVHHLWHTSLEDFETFLEQLGMQLDGMTEQDGHRP